MRRRHITSIVLLCLTIVTAHAVTVNCQPGKLNTLLTNQSVTELTITGKMDARDFRFISDKMRHLKVLNLLDVSILSHTTTSAPLYANLHTYRAGELPSTALAQFEQLTTVVLPRNAIAIGEGTFAGCTKLASVTLPGTLQSIGDYAFARCTALKTVKVPASLRSIGRGAYAHCTSLTRVALDIYPFASPANATNNSNPETVPIEFGPGHLTSIGDQAFLGCKNLTSVALSNNLEYIGKEAFAGTGLKSIDLSSMKQLTTIGSWCYASTPLTSANIPNNVTSLGWGAFLLNTSLAHVTIPSGISTLSPLTLAGNKLVTAVDLSNIALDSIGDYALYDNQLVQELIIPSSTHYVGTRSMAGMKGLQKLTTRASRVPHLGEAVWQNVNQPAIPLMVPAGTENAYHNAEQWKLFDIQSGFILGDVNGDGVIDISDVNAVINYMLGKPNATFIFDAADIDGNGIIDIADVNGVLNLLLGVSMASPSFVTPNTGDMIVIDNFAINENENRTLSIKLHNSINYTALQCVIHLPQGLEYIEGSVTLGNRSTEQHHVVAVHDGNDVRIALYSIPGNDFKGGAEDAVLTMTVKCTGDLAEVSTIEIDHVVMSNDAAETFNAPSSVTQVSKSSGICDTTMPSDKVFAANGSLHIIAQSAGTAQLVNMNGMFRSLSVQVGSNAYHNIDPGVYVVRLNGHSHKVKI